MQNTNEPNTYVTPEITADEALYIKIAIADRVRELKTRAELSPSAQKELAALCSAYEKL